MAQVTLEFINSPKASTEANTPEQKLGPPEKKAAVGAMGKAGLGESKFMKGKKR